MAQAKAKAPQRTKKKAKAAGTKAPKLATTGTMGAEPTQKAMASGDGRATLLAALAWWREQRSPALADLVDAISAHVSGAAVEGDREWASLARSKDPMDLGRLLPAIPSLSASALPGAAEQLSQFADDPRIARAVATWAIDPPTTSSSTYPFWTRMLERVRVIGDVRVIPLLKKRLAKPPQKSQFWPKFYAALERVLTRMKELEPPVVDEAALKKLAGAVPRLSRPGSGATSTASAPAPRAAPAVEGAPLHQAATHLAAGHLVAAIDALLVKWRETRAPAIADALDRATRLLPSWDRPLATRGTEVDDAWMRALATPGESMPQLLQYVCVAGGPRNNTLVERRLMELGSLPEDPRIALRLTELACQFGASPERTAYWRSIFDTIAQARDVRTFEPLRKHYRDFTGTYYNHHAQARRILGKMAMDPPSAFPSWPLSLSTGDAGELAKIEGELSRLEAKRDRTELELLRAIAEQWTDDAPRLVYADWLSERGHPRGELIVLACKKSRTAAEKERLDELSKLPFLYGPLRELGTLEDVVGGIPRRVDVEHFAGMLTWRAVTGHPLLSIVETIRLSGNPLESLEDVARLVLHPDAGRLRRILKVVGEDTRLDAALPGFRREGQTLVRD